MTAERVPPLGRDEFIRQLRVEFPEAAAAISEYEAGLLHCEAGAFLRATEEAMDAGRAWLAEQHFRFIERMLATAGAELENALLVSYLEGLALGDQTPQRHRLVKARMPEALRQRLIEIDEWWK